MMFLGLCLLANTQNLRYGYTCYLRCDFRGISEDFNIDFPDTLTVLAANQKQTVIEMNEIMKQIGAKLKIKPLRSTQLFSFWKLHYTKKTKAVSTFHIDIDKTDD